MKKKLTLLELNEISENRNKLISKKEEFVKDIGFKSNTAAVETGGYFRLSILSLPLWIFLVSLAANAESLFTMSLFSIFAVSMVIASVVKIFLCMRKEMEIAKESMSFLKKIDPKIQYMEDDLNEAISRDYESYFEEIESLKENEKLELINKDLIDQIVKTTKSKIEEKLKLENTQFQNIEYVSKLKNNNDNEMENSIKNI